MYSVLVGCLNLLAANRNFPFSINAANQVVDELDNEISKKYKEVEEKIK